MNEDIGYLIILLSRVIGFLVAGHLSILMVYFIGTIKIAEMPIDWSSILSKNLGE